MTLAGFWVIKWGLPQKLLDGGTTQVTELRAPLTNSTQIFQRKVIFVQERVYSPPLVISGVLIASDSFKSVLISADWRKSMEVGLLRKLCL